MQIFIAALGGALGASARYGLSLLPGKWDFPVWTFLTNLCGAVIIGSGGDFGRGSARELQECCTVLEDRILWRIYDLFHVFFGGVESSGAGQNADRRALYCG